jgi:dephospho-CoA kinase
MLLIGLTGGIGMGKSTVTEYLQSRLEPLVDTDVLARRLVQPGEPALGEIRETFGGNVLDSEGALNRRTLADLVFASDFARRKLEAILHPRIRAVWKQQVENWRSAGASRAVVVIPLLYETGAEVEFDRVICVACTRETQQARLLGRGWSAEEIKRRMAAQWPIGKKIDRADRVIWNESTIEMCAEQSERVFARSH